MNATPTITERKLDATTTSRISWGAIFAGIVIALMASALLNLLGLGLGFTAFTLDTDVLAGLGIGSIIWLVISAVVSALIGGWVAGRLARSNLTLEGSLHGLVVWGLATLFSFVLMATMAGAVVSGTVNAVGQGISLAGSGAAALGKGAAQVAPQVTKAAQNLIPDLAPAVDEIKQQADNVLQQARQTANQEAASDEMRTQLSEAVTNFLQASSDSDRSSAQQKLTDFLAQNANMSQQQAEQTVNDWQQKFNDLKQAINEKTEQAKETAITTTEQTADVLGAIAIVTFFVLLLGAVAGALGGIWGAARGREDNIRL